MLGVISSPVPLAMAVHVTPASCKEAGCVVFLGAQEDWLAAISPPLYLHCSAPSCSSLPRSLQLGEPHEGRGFAQCIGHRLPVLSTIGTHTQFPREG